MSDKKKKKYRNRLLRYNIPAEKSANYVAPRNYNYNYKFEKHLRLHRTYFPDYKHAYFADYKVIF